MNNNTTKDSQPIHKSHSLKQQPQQQHQAEERFSEEEYLPWEKVTTKQRNNRNQSIEKTKLFVENLNQSTTEKDLNELFGLIFGKRAASKCQKTNTRVSQKVSPS